MIIGCVSVVRHYNKIVAIKCAKGRGIILPGGKWHKGETFQEAAKRELFEETGLVATKQKLIFGGMAPDLIYCYTFRTQIERLDTKDSKEGQVVLATWSELFQSEFGPYYRLFVNEDSDIT